MKASVNHDPVKKSEKEKLLESEERYRHVIQNASDVIFTTDINGNILFGNNASLGITGYSFEEFTKMNYLELTLPEFKRKVQFFYMRQFKNKFQTSYLEYPLKNKSGDIIWLGQNSNLIFENDQIKGFHFIARNITERKMAEDALKESEEKYRELVEASPDAIVIYLEGKVVFANHSSVSLMRASGVDELIGKPVIEFVHPSYRELFIRRKLEMNKSGDTTPLAEEKFLRLDGSEIDVEVKAIPINFNKKPAIQIIARDITERKQAEKEINDLAKFPSENPSPVLRIANDGTLLYVNEAGKKQLPEWKLQTGQSAHNMLQDVVFKTLDNEEIQEVEFEHRGKVISFYVVPIVEEGYSNLYGRDITERKRAEIELIEAKEKAEESDRLKSAFLANMSHEIRTPMNGILSFTELLKEPGLTDEKKQEYIGIIEKSGDRLLNIINDIINISKIESGHVDIFISDTNINEQVQYIFNFFKPETEQKKLQIFFKNSLSSKEAFIKTDKEKVIAVLTNLVKNAIKFTSDGSIEFGYEKKSNYLEFFVKDTGTGVLQAQKEIIFDRFRQGSESLNRNYEGAGLGLTISKAYVEMLGGKIWINSDLDKLISAGLSEKKGSTFYFTIPYDPVQEVKTTDMVDIEDNAIENQIKNLKILIAEDDEISQTLITLTTRRIASEVIKVGTGTEAVEACRNNPDIDLVFMDIKMPEMDGYEATRQIRKFNKEVVIIAQTAYGLEGDKAKAIDAGFNDYISKPVDTALLMKMIKNILIK